MDQIINATTAEEIAAIVQTIPDLNSLLIFDQGPRGNFFDNVSFINFINYLRLVKHGRQAFLTWPHGIIDIQIERCIGHMYEEYVRNPIKARTKFRKMFKCTRLADATKLYSLCLLMQNKILSLKK